MMIFAICYFSFCFISFGFINAYFQSKYDVHESESIRILTTMTISLGGLISLILCVFLSENFKYGWFLGKESKNMKIERVEKRLDG